MADEPHVLIGTPSADGRVTIEWCMHYADVWTNRLSGTARMRIRPSRSMA